MDNLFNYVNVNDYCKCLSEITNVSVEEVKQIVITVFTEIRENKIESYKGFLSIESELNDRMIQGNNNAKKLEKKQCIPA